MVTCAQFYHCHKKTYQCETCMTAGALKMYTYPTNRIVCIEKLILAVLMVIYTGMRIRTGKKSANPQVLSELIYLKTQLFAMTNIFPLVLWWFPHRCCPNEPILQNLIVWNEKLIPTILMVTCAQVTLPWEYILERNLHNYRCSQNVPILQTYL